MLHYAFYEHMYHFIMQSSKIKGLMSGNAFSWVGEIMTYISSTDSHKLETFQREYITLSDGFH